MYLCQLMCIFYCRQNVCVQGWYHAWLQRWGMEAYRWTHWGKWMNTEWWGYRRFIHCLDAGMHYVLYSLVCRTCMHVFWTEHACSVSRACTCEPFLLYMLLIIGDCFHHSSSQAFGKFPVGLWWSAFGTCLLLHSGCGAVCIDAVRHYMPARECSKYHKYKVHKAYVFKLYFAMIVSFYHLCCIPFSSCL